MIVRNSIVENLRWMPPKTAEEIKEARENLIDDVMHTCFADDMDDEESANRAYLETLSNDGLQEMIDEWNNYDGVNYYGELDEIDEGFTYLKPKTKEELEVAEKEMGAKALAALENEVDDYIETQMKNIIRFNKDRSDLMYTYAYWMRNAWHDYEVSKKNIKVNVPDMTKKDFFDICRSKAEAAGAAWDEAEFKDGWEANS